MKHTGKCDCGCGQHSIWTIVRSEHDRKLWFLTLDHLRRWQAVREAQQKRMIDAFPFLADPCSLLEPVWLSDLSDSTSEYEAMTP